MNAQLAFARPFEMFDDISDVNGTAFNPCLYQRLVQDFSRRANERFALKVFLVPRLFPNQQNIGVFGPLPEDCLCRIAPEVASFALRRRRAQFSQRDAAGCSLGCGHCRLIRACHLIAAILMKSFACATNIAAEAGSTCAMCNYNIPDFFTPTPNLEIEASRLSITRTNEERNVVELRAKQV